MKKFDNEVAKNYAVDIRKKVPGYELCHEILFSFLSNVKREKITVLVIGPGTGEEISHLAELNPLWKFVGVEASLPMAQIAREHIKETGLDNRVEIIHSRIEEYKTEEKYDIALSILVSHFIGYESKTSFFAHISNILMPNGEIIIFDLFKTSEGIQESWMNWSQGKGLTLEESEQMRLNIRTKFFPLGINEFETLLMGLNLKIEECFLQSLGFHGFIIKKIPTET